MIHKVKSILLCLTVILTTALVPVQNTYAVECDSINDSFLGFPSWNRGLNCIEDTTSDGKIVVRTEIDTAKDGIQKFIWTVVLNVLDILLRIAGILAVIMLIVSGYRYLTSAGVPDKIAKAKTGMLRAIVGLVIAMLASTIIYFVVGKVV
jgi:hypothetical protein